MTETATETARRKDLQSFRLVMTSFAVVSVIAGAVIGLFPEILSLSPWQALSLSSVLLLIGIVDTLVLLQWRQLFE